MKYVLITQKGVKGKTLPNSKISLVAIYYTFFLVTDAQIKQATVCPMQVFK
jgi:hypothetical protein